MRSKVFLVSCLTLIISEALLNACGSSASVSEIKAFDDATFTPGDVDPNRRIGADQDGPFALYGKAVGSAFVIDYVPSALTTQWSTLVKIPKGIRGGEIMSVPYLEFSPSYVPMWGRDFKSAKEHWSAQNFWECARYTSDSRNHEGSFQIRMRYKRNGEEQLVVTPPIAIAHKKAPNYDELSPAGVVQLRGIVRTGTITDFVIEIGMIVPRKFSGTCTHTEGIFPDRDLLSNRFNVNITKIVVPHAENK